MKRMAHLCLYFFLVAALAGCAGKSTSRRSNDYRKGMESLKKGSEWYMRGCYDRALDFFYRAHEHFTASDERDAIAACLNNIGNTYRYMGDARSAHRFIDEALDVYRDLGDQKGAAYSLSNKAAVFIDEQRLGDADVTLQQAVAIVDAHGLRFAPLWRNLGVLHLKRKQNDAARAFLERAEKETPPDDPAVVASVAHALGSLMESAGDWFNAVRYYRQALEADRRAGFYEGVAGDLAATGRCLKAEGNHKEAASFFKRSIKIYALIGKPARVQEILSLLQESADAAQIDISLTRLLVGQWVEGKRRFSPCD